MKEVIAMYSPNELKHSLECRWRKKQIKLYLGILIFVFGICILFGCLTIVIHLDELLEDKMLLLNIFLTTLGILGVTCLCLVPFLIYSFNDYRKIIKLAENSTLHEVVLDHPSVSFNYRGAVYYTVHFQTQDNHSISLETKPLWSNFWFFPIEEYNNKKVEILYNKELNRVIVLGLKGWQKDIIQK